MKLIIINGPNLNLLGKREKDIYGKLSFDKFFGQLKKKYKNLQLEYFQSNLEGELIDKLHKVGFSYNGILLNAGGYTHTSVALRDAVASIKAPVIEIHISNIYARESFRQKSLLSEKCRAVICGLGLDGYKAGIEFFLSGNKKK